MTYFASEFKLALRNLGARHPEAYDDFVKLLQPAEAKASRIRVTKRHVTGSAAAADESETGDGVAPAAADDSVFATMTEKPHSERQLWRTVERKKSVGKEEDVVNPQWSTIERNMSA